MGVTGILVIIIVPTVVMLQPKNEEHLVPTATVMSSPAVSLSTTVIQSSTSTTTTTPTLFTTTTSTISTTTSSSQWESTSISPSSQPLCDFVAEMTESDYGELYNSSYNGLDLLILGRKDASRAQPSKLLSFDPCCEGSGCSWTINDFENINYNTKTGNYQTCTTLLNGKLYFFGGEGGTAFAKSISYLDIEDNEG